MSNAELESALSRYSKKDKKTIKKGKIIVENTLKKGQLVKLSFSEGELTPVESQDLLEEIDYFESCKYWLEIGKSSAVGVKNTVIKEDRNGIGYTIHGKLVSSLI